LDHWTAKEDHFLKKLRRWVAPKKKVPFKENISAAIYTLKATLDKIRRNSTALQRRDTHFFHKCIDAQLHQSPDRAILYANECAEIRKLAKLLLSSELALEKAIIRLQTISELSDIVGTITPILGIVQETKGRLKGVIPSVTSRLEEVSGMLNSSMTAMGSIDPSVPGVTHVNPEVQTILNEANTVADEAIREKFPVLPQELQAAEAAEAEEATPLPVALTATGEAPPPPDPMVLNRQVYAYIKEQEGKLSVIQCASYLGVFPTDVEQAILRLKHEGKVILE
jgi:division protein CdvB (Snf7/Vps24/ESCRT-III family)